MQAREAAGEAPVEFGPEAREQLFLLGPGWAYLNHGSYGATLRLLAEAQTWWQRRQEEQPVRFMETEALAGGAGQGCQQGWVCWGRGRG